MIETLVYREYALPVSAFDRLKHLQRRWKVRTNAEVLTRVLMEYHDTEPEPLMKNAEAEHRAGRPE